MKILRSVTRRGFTIGTAGWFSVLKQNTWFPATRLPGGFHDPGSRTRVWERKTPGHGPGLPAAVRIQVLDQPVHDHPLMRPALIILAAMTITSALLAWIMYP